MEEEEEEEEGMRRNLPRRRPRSCSSRSNEKVSQLGPVPVMVSVYTYFIPSNKCHGYKFSQCHKVHSVYLRIVLPAGHSCCTPTICTMLLDTM